MSRKASHEDLTQQIISAAERAGMLRPRDLEGASARVYLRRLEQRGLLQRVGRGLYVPADAEMTEHHSLAEACKQVPQGVVCLLSALQFHGLTTQLPREVWLAIGPKAWRPQISHPPLRIVRFSGQALEAGVEAHCVEGVTVRVYNAAKTTVDCFKYRNKIGLDVALESLRDCLRQRKCTIDELWHYAGICRVAGVIKPYLEALV